MALLEVLPEEVENGLRSLDTIPRQEMGADKDSRIVFATDINVRGEFSTEWLVADREQIFVFAPNGGNKAKLIKSVPLGEVREVRAEMQIGNGELQALTSTETVPLMRFSHAVNADANLVARKLSALARGEDPGAETVKRKRRHCPKCQRILADDTDVCPACLDKRAILMRLFQFLAPYKPQVLLGVALIVLSTATDLTPPYVAGRIVDLLAPKLVKGTTKVPVHALVPSMHVLILWVALLAVVKLASTGLNYAQQRLNPWLGGRIAMDIRMALYAKLNQLSLSYYDKRSTGSVMSRVTGDSDNLWDFLQGGVPWLTSNVLTLVGIGIILFRLNYQLALLMLIPTPGIFLLARWFMPRARRRYHVVWHRISKMYSVLNSTLSGMRVVKAFAQEDREVNFFGNRNQSVFLASYDANAFRATFWPLLGLLMSAGSYIIWLVGGHFVISKVMTIGVLTMFNGYLMSFYQPFMNFSQVLDWSTRSMTAAERVFEVLDTDPEIVDAPDAVAMPNMRGDVEFDHVTFTYDNARRALENFTLCVKSGEMIGLVGHSGAGKTTIINMLSRFYDPSEGTILVDGVDIRNISRADFRRQLGIVPQEPFLFPGTIYDNIAYSRPDATPLEVITAAKAANCHEFIMRFPDGYDTSVGERGQRLSGGERQRISIARAILHNPRILILDEATASVDTETEKLIQDAIARLIQNRTTFAIAHRLSTLRNADRLVVMKDGKMVESGTHDELMEIDGVYAGLVRVQTQINQLRAL